MNLTSNKGYAIAMGQIIMPWKKLYLATTRNYAYVSKTANIIYKKLQAIYSMLYKRQI